MALKELIDEANNNPDFQIRPYIALVVFAIVAFSIIKSVTSEAASPLRKIPGPWFGPWTTIHLRYLFARGTIWSYAEDSHTKYGSVVRLGPRQVWVASKDALKDILVKTDLPKVAMYAEISRDRESPGLFGEIRPNPHKNLRRFLGPAFTVTSVDKLDSFFKACTGTLIRNYTNESEKNKCHGGSNAFTTDLMRDLHCLALDIMGESSFGKGFGQIDNIFDPSKIATKRDREWSKIPNAIFDGLAARYRMVFFKRALRKMGVDLKFDWPSHMTRAISSLIDDRRALDKKEQTQQIAADTRIDILQHMLDEGNRPDTGMKMSNQDIIDQMSELLLAGSETTSGTIACIFLEIARNPDVAEKLYASLPALTPEDPVLDSKTVREDPQYRYLEAVLKENLRMHPIASEMGRRTLQSDYIVDGHVLPKHTVVSASYRKLHLDGQYWPQPERFWPERWLEGEEREDAPEPDNDAYYPFSGGAHSCIGKNFAYAEMRTVAANLLSRFRVVERDYKKIQFRQYITMQFHDGSWNVELTPRW